jgi:methylated-DNA-[protein]-cysteine S-methyltransferase
MNYQTIYHSPVGKLRLVSDGKNLIGLHFCSDRYQETPEPESSERPPFLETSQQLDEYFRGVRTAFDLPIRFIGSLFQVQAWQALQTIPFGETISYKEQAERIGSVPRAVGLANGQNPIAVIVPCHRVIGANGHLVGYGGGLELKKALLNFEAIVRDFGPQPFTALKPHANPRPQRFA